MQDKLKDVKSICFFCGVELFVCPGCKKVLCRCNSMYCLNCDARTCPDCLKSGNI